MSNPSSADLHEKIRIKAYLLWEKAGCPGGDGQSFWEEAEKVITRMAKLTEAKKAKAAGGGSKPAAKAKAKAKPVIDPVLVTTEKPEKKKKKKKEKSDKKKSDKKKEKK